MQGKDGEGHLGESIPEWLWEIAAMNSIMGIWDLIYLSTPQNIRKLKEMVIWNLDESGKPCNIEIRYGKIWSNKQLLFYSNGSLDDPTWNVRIFRRYTKPDEGWKIGDVVEPALIFLADFINQQIEHKIETRLQYNRVDREMPFLHIYLEPTTLKDALWLMCLLEITDNIRLSRCRFCGNWFGQTQALRVYCSDKCKQADYRKRIKITTLH